MLDDVKGSEIWQIPLFRVSPEPAATSALDSSGKAKSCREALRALPQRPLELLPRPGNTVFGKQNGNQIKVVNKVVNNKW